ncbi:energy transducer TonB [Pseudomonas sp. JDS08PS003]|uniref:energy transducer TonB n=1 Tax=Pseudomonas sp. JDS08PS003 TaxID=2497162 RepID=UPI00385749A6
MTAMIMHSPIALPMGSATAGFWRNSLAATLALALHAGVLAALVLGWSVDKPQVETPPVLTTQLVMLAPPAAPAEALPAVAEVAPPPPAPTAPLEPPKPRVDPQVQAQKLEQAALARRRVEDKKREQAQEQQRQQRERLDAEQRQRDTERLAQEQAQRAEQSRLAAERGRQQAAQAAADSRQYQPLSKEAPDYPQRALDKNLEGDCTVEYSVNPQGRVENPKVIDGCHPLFMRPSLAAVATFRYQPRLIDGQAVTVPAVRNTFHYRIK